MSKANTIDLVKLRQEKNQKEVLKAVGQEVEKLVRKYATFIPEPEQLERITIHDSLFFQPPVFYEQQIRVDDEIVARIQIFHTDDGLTDYKVLEGV